MKFSRIAAVAALGTVVLSAGASATPIPYNFSQAIAFSFVSAFTSTGANAASNLATATEFTFGNQPPNVLVPANDVNANTTANPITSDATLAAQMSYQKFLSSSNLGTSGQGGTIANGGTNTFYFINFVNQTTGSPVIGGFETQGFGITSIASTDANHLNITLTGLFTPNPPNVGVYSNTAATLTIGFTSQCPPDSSNPALCSVSASGTLAAGQFATAVPEPATLALLGTSILGLGLVLRRKAS